MAQINIDRSLTYDAKMFYGEKTQNQQLLEELLELSLALHRVINGFRPTAQHKVNLLEELADVFIMLDYALTTFDCDIIQEFIYAKAVSYTHLTLPTKRIV